MEAANLLGIYLAFLRSLYLVHQNSHWTVQGQVFYGQHLMFERIYQSAQENADLIAEKSIGLGYELNLAEQNRLIAKISTKYLSGSPLENSLKAEEDFLKLAEKTYLALKETGSMTLGLDDALMSISSDRETAIYLLKQSLKA